MLFKLSLSNIRRSLRDYAIYFFTLIIGVSVFYVFNAIGGQAATMRMSESQYEIIGVLETLLSGMSIYVAGVLALLIVYASRFLMKRRNKEFVEPRQYAVYIITVMMPSIPLTAIGDYMGGRDHSTIIHARNKITDDIREDKRIKIVVADLKNMLLNR